MADFVFHEVEKHKIPGPTGTVEVEFNSTDAFFLERALKACDRISGGETEREKALENAAGGDRWEPYHRFDEEARAVIDELFNAPVCDTAFNGVWMFSFNGDVPLWLSIILWVTDEMYEAGMSAENRALRRIKEYENKYTRKYKKK